MIDSLDRPRRLASHHLSAVLDLPRRQSLVNQTAGILRAEILKKTWTDSLPGERSLCETLQVSRNTLRTALAQLRREGIVRSVQGSANRILTKPRAKGKRLRSRDVALLAPEALERLRPSQTLWIDELRAMLSERECRLHVFHGRQYFRASPGRALRKLVDRHPHGCWILMLSNESVQRWFESQRVPAIVAGSVHGDIDLPFRDLDHRAMCRHAAGVLLAQGHRQLALFMARSDYAGDRESESGFFEGVRQSSHPNATATLAHHDGTKRGMRAVLQRLVSRKEPVSAILVANAYHYLTVVTSLTQMGLRVPEDMSVVSRDEDRFLSFLVPEPARYETSPREMAKALVHPVIELLEEGLPASAGSRLMPEFIRGESITKLR